MRKTRLAITIVAATTLLASALGYLLLAVFTATADDNQDN